MKRLLFIITEDWYFVSHRLHLAKAAISAGYQVALLSKFTNHRNIVLDEGIRVFDWSLNRSSSNPFLEIHSICGIVSTIRQFQPDLVHAVAIKPVLYSAIACRLTRLQNRVFALGGLGFIFSSQKRFAKLIRPLIVLALRMLLRGQNVKVILQNTDDCSVLYLTGIVNKDKIRLIRGAGVDTNYFSPHQLPTGTPLVVLPARMLWDKGVGEFVECSRALKEKGIVANFLLVGSPDTHNPESVSIDQLKKWKEEGVVDWCGHIEDMPNIYKQSSIVCLPSYREGLPKVLLEAASSGRPIVAYDVPGCREVVINDVNGFLVPLKDEDALVQAIEKLLRDHELCIRFSKAARELVLAEFSQEKIAEETMQVWEEVLS